MAALPEWRAFEDHTHVFFFLSVFFFDIHTLDGQCVKILDCTLDCTQYSVQFRIAPRKGECVSKECLTLSKVLSEEHPTTPTFLFPIFTAGWAESQCKKILDCAQ